MSKSTRRMIIVGMLCSLLLTGCHKPTFDHLEPSAEKWALTVLAQAESDQEKAGVESLITQFAQEQKTTAFQVKWVTSEEAPTALQTLAEQPGIDLVVLASDVRGAGEIAAKHPDKRFTILGGEETPAGNNIRYLTHDQKKKLFLAGVIAAEANKASREPFSVLVDEPLAETDERLQMIVAGALYAGSKVMPMQVEKSQSQLSGRVMVMLGELTEAVSKKAEQTRMALIRTDEKYANLGLQENVVAEPVSLLTTALPGEAQALMADKWQGKQSQVPVKSMYNLIQAEILSDSQFATDLTSRLEFIEAQLATGTIKPEEILADKIQSRSF